MENPARDLADRANGPWRKHRAADHTGTDIIMVMLGLWGGLDVTAKRRKVSRTCF